MKYKKLTGIILKKQNYREADQILTLWTRQAGKVRCLARGVRLPKSKLNFCLSELGICEVDLVGHNGLATLIGVKNIKQHSQLRQNLQRAAMGFFMAELVMKMTADEQPNESVFDLLSKVLLQLDDREIIPEYRLVDEFALKLSKLLGFGSPAKAQSHQDISNFLENLLERKINSESFLISTN